MNEREQLACLVQQWNENRLDLFHLSFPTEDLEVEGVMRFYFQDGGEKVLTKCVRVSSTATTRAVVDALQEKFLPDLKMLSNDTYSLWEVHENGDERQLNEEEKPLLVQLMWHKDDREGRFLLRRDKTPPIPLNAIQLQEVDQRNGRFAKKKEKEPRKKQQKEFVHVNSGREPQSQDDIYKQVPFNNFTRTISNPEAVMRKRREKKLETKIKEMTYGGSLKVYGGEIVPSRPYITILAGMNDSASKILGEALEKYGLEMNADEYILIEVTTDSDEPRRSMSDLRDVDGRPFGPNEYPILQMAKSGENGFDSFLAIKKKPHDYQVPSTSIIPQSSVPLVSPTSMNMPTLTIVNPDGRLSNHRIGLNEGLTEVGSDRQMSNFSPHNIYLDGIEIRGRHAAITNMEGVVTLTPSTRDAYLEVNGEQIMQTEILRDGDVVRIGADNLFKFSTNQPQAQCYSEMPASRASTTRCVPSDYCSLPMNGGNDYYPPSVSGSSISSSRHGHDDIMNSNNNILPTMSKVEAINVPISIQIGDYNVWDFLGEVMSNRATSSSEFRLSPAYSLYLAVRFFHTHNKPYSVQFFSRIETNFRQIAQECSSRDDLIFWLANASEFHHLIERDLELKGARFGNGKLGLEIERIFRRLVVVVQSSIRPGARAMLDIHLNDQDSTRDILSLLDNTLRMCRTCRLNPALTIQLCGHLLHMVNSFVFNNLVAVGFPPVPLTTRLGKCLRNRLEIVHRFCEGMGVELAAECHLDRSRQAANLLAAQKNDVATLGSTCYKLNSLQIVHLLSSFEPIDGEIPCDDDVIDRIVRLAEKQADHLTLEDGNRVTLEEADELNLPFLIPQDGYFIDQLKTVPEGLWQYLIQLQHRRLCHSVNRTSQQQASNSYNGSSVHPSMTSSMSAMESNHNHQNQNQQQHQNDMPQPIVRSVSQTTLTSIPTTQFGDSFGSTSSDVVIRVMLRKNGGGIGLSIVAAQGVGDRKMGIYVKKVMDGTPAAMDGRLETGDQLLSVNNHSLIGISQEEAAKLMTSSGNEVHFEVRKRAAHRNGLSAWLVANTPNTPSTSHPFTPPSSSSVSSQPPPPPPSYNNVNRSSYEAPPSYNNRYPQQQQQVNVQPSRTSAFVAPNTSHIQQHYQHHNMHHTIAPIQDPTANRHYRSSSASDLQQNDPNVSMSQLSITSSARSSVFDKLPSHYRHSTRPTVIQPARPGAQSPSSLRKTAPSPSNLYRPTSASNLFAPPRQSGALVGYSSNAARESTQDIHRALNDLEMSSPLARSTPNEDDYRVTGYGYQNHQNSQQQSHQNYASLHQMRPSSMYGYASNQASPSSATNSTNVNSVPHSHSYSNSLSNSINNSNNYGIPSRSNNNISSNGNNISPRVNVTAGTITTNRMSSQEPAIVRPVELNMSGYSHQKTHSTSAATIKGAVPTAITQALQLQNQNGGMSSGLRPIRPTSGLRERLQDKDVRMLEETNIALMSYEAVNEELDRLDMKGHNMSEEETRRYRELLNVAAEQSRARRLLADIRPPQIERDIPIMVQRSPPRNMNGSGNSNGRIETVIDDVQHSSSSVENMSPVSPPESRKVQFIDEITQHASNTATLFASDVPLLDSPGIVGTNEIYRDPRQRRLNELQDRKNGDNGADGAKLGFRDKQKLFARQIGEEGVPRHRVDASSAQRQIETELLQSQQP